MDKKEMALHTTKRRDFLKQSGVGLVGVGFGGAASGTATAESKEEVDDRGDPVSGDETAVQTQSSLPINPESPPDGTIEASDFQWLSEGAPQTGNEVALRVTDDGGVEPEFRIQTDDDLTVDLHWRHDSGGSLAYLFNDFDSASIGFRAFTNGIAGDGLLFRNPFGGSDIFIGSDFQDGEWYNIRVVLDSDDSSYTVYIDGEEVAKTDYDGSGWTADDRFRVMGRQSGSSTTSDYDQYVIASEAIHPGDGDVTSDLLQYALEDGSGETVQNAVVEEALLRVDGKRNQIADIRSAAIDGLPELDFVDFVDFSEEDIDARAEELVDAIESDFDDMSGTEKEQSREALRRLVAAQRVTSKAAAKPQNGSLEQTARVILSMALGRTSDRLAKRLGNSRLASATEDIIKSVTGSIRSVLRRLKRRLPSNAERQLDDIIFDIQTRYEALLGEFEEYIKPAAATGAREGTESAAAFVGVTDAIPDEFWEQLAEIEDEFVSKIGTLLYTAYFITPDPVDTTEGLYEGLDVDTEFTVSVDLPEFDPTEFDVDDWIPIDEVPDLEDVPSDVYDQLDEFRNWEYPDTWGYDWERTPDWIDSLEWPVDFELFPEYDDIDLPFDRDDIDLPSDLEWPVDFDIDLDDLPDELDSVDVELPSGVRDELEDAVPDSLPDGVELPTDHISIPNNVSFPDSVNVSDADVRAPDCDDVDLVDCDALDPRNYSPSRDDVTDRVPEFDTEIDLSTPSLDLSTGGASVEPSETERSWGQNSGASVAVGSSTLVPGVPTGTYPAPPEWPELDPEIWREPVVPSWDPTGPIEWPDIPRYELPDKIEVEVDLSPIVDSLSVPDVPHLSYARELEDELGLGASVAGVNASIDEQADQLADSLDAESLSEQPPERRRQVTGTLEGAIDRLTEVVNKTFQIVQTVLEAVDIVQLGAVLGVLVGALVFVKNPPLGVALIVFCGKVAVKIETLNRVINGGQLAIGLGYLQTVNLAHDIGVRALLQTDLQFDDIERPEGGVYA